MQKLKITIWFFLAAIAGTLLHECGHYAAGILLGGSPVIRYRSTVFGGASGDFIFTLGGPLQTIVTGALGFIGLMWTARKETIDAYRTKHLLWIVLTFFWSREVLRALLCMLPYETGWPADESKLLNALNVPLHIGYIALLIVFGALLLYVTLSVVKEHRKELVIYGVAGSIIGWVAWMYWLGPLLLP
jgi:hypothetical protein